jgi:hypothetical protein
MKSADSWPPTYTPATTLTTRSMTTSPMMRSGKASTNRCAVVGRTWPISSAPQVGRDAIVRRFAGPLPPVLHLLANESISVNGDDAMGYWTYLQPSVLGGRAYWVAGRYHIDFRREDGRWRIRHLQVQGIFEAPYDQGWAQAGFFQR